MLTIISYKKAMKRKVHLNESYRESHRVRRDTGSMMEKKTWSSVPTTKRLVETTMGVPIIAPEYR